ncbi:MAG: hypothetical protein AVDCRST_MAG43-1639, partial [uncultured Thermomicrobiales bacterium]
CSRTMDPSRSPLVSPSEGWVASSLERSSASTCSTSRRFSSLRSTAGTGPTRNGCGSSCSCN